jgi:hypothetical protein
MTPTRRNFLQSLSGTALASLLHRDASAASSNPLSPKGGHHVAKAKAVIQIFCPNQCWRSARANLSIPMES